MVQRRPKRFTQSSESLITGEGLLSFTFKRSSARHSLAIVIDEKALVTVYAPYTMSRKKIDDFIHEKLKWIFEKIEEAKKEQALLSRRMFDHDHQFLFMGKKCNLIVREQLIKRVRLNFDGVRWMVEVPFNLTLTQRQEKIKNSMIKWYKRQAEEILGGRLFYYARHMDVSPKKIAIRSHKRIWGEL